MAEEPQLISLRRASKLVGVSHTTIEDWCGKYGIGQCVDGRYRISISGLKRVAKAKSELAKLAKIAG